MKQSTNPAPDEFEFIEPVPFKGEPYCQPCNQEGSTIKIIRGVCDSYNDRLKALLAGNNTNFKPIDIGCPHKCLLDCGLPNLPIQVSVKILTGKSSQANHPFKFLDIIHLPEYINQPIAVFRSATSMDDTKVILTEMEAEGVNIVVVVRPNQEYKGFFVNDIRSIYPKHNLRPILEWISVYNLMEYYNKEKILNWLGKHQYNPDEVTKLIKDSTKLVI